MTLDDAWSYEDHQRYRGIYTLMDKRYKEDRICSKRKGLRHMQL